MKRKQRDQTERIAALKAVVDGLKAKEAELQEQIKSAVGELLQAERDGRRCEPLTAKQREILELLVNNDATVTESDLYGGRRFWVEMPPDKDESNVTINQSVFYGLLSREAIGGRAYKGALRYEYSLTDHGRSLVNGGTGKGLSQIATEESVK